MKRKTARILVADDEQDARRTLRQQLEDAGYAVCTVSSGGDAVLMCDLDPPDVLIMDVHLPDMDGFEVCERIRRGARGSDLTVIIITDPVDDMTKSYLGQMVEYVGGDYFIAKPCDSHLIVQLVDDVARWGRSVGKPRRAGPPTHVVWPTVRPRTPVSARARSFT